MESKQKTVSVVIGRFQVAELHLGHKSLIDIANRESDDLLILIGCREGEFTNKDPFDFEMRKQMIQNDYPQATIKSIFDTLSDDQWSKNVDEIIDELHPESRVILFGSRDSFIPYYLGKHLTQEIKHREFNDLSGSQERNYIKDNPTNSVDFRKGVIYANQVRFPVAYQTTDVAVLNKEKTKVILGRKPGNKYFQFIGGFVDPTDDSLEMAAEREVVEEVGGIKTKNYQYIKSARMNDLRYQGQRDQIMTIFFAAEYVSGEPVADDDIEEVQWFDVSDIESVLASYHQEIGKSLKDFINNSK